jgi:hypothetical protein
MDEPTLLANQLLWVDEPQPHRATSFEHLSAAEQSVYQSIRQGRWGRNIRLEQERIPWGDVWRALQSLVAGVN